MKPPPERQAIQQVMQRLGELLEVEPEDARLRQQATQSRADGIVDLAGTTFVIEWKSSGSAARVAHAAEQARRWASELDSAAIPLVAVPFMGEVGQRVCQDANVAWLDLSGNARIFAPGIRVRIEGEPNRFKRPGRPSTAFAPKSSRITRWLLMHPNRPIIQRELAEKTGVDEGFTSRIVARLEQDNLVVRDANGAIRPRDPDLLLDAWSEAYDFSKHRVIRGHVTARSGDLLLRRVAGELIKHGDRHAATGLAAAWLLTRFAGFRIVTVYMNEEPSKPLLEDLAFRDEESGANLWLVIPDDEGVFDGVSERDGVRCVHPVQAYLDLRAHPERAGDAARELRTEWLTWSAHA